MLKKHMKNLTEPYFNLVPALLVFGVFLFYPFIKTIYLSRYKTNKMGQAIFFISPQGLANIDESIYERASVDGANGIQKFSD